MVMATEPPASYAPDYNTIVPSHTPSSFRNQTIQEIRQSVVNVAKTAKRLPSLNEQRQQSLKQVQPGAAQKNSAGNFVRPPLPIFFEHLGGIDYLLEQIHYQVRMALLKPHLFTERGARPTTGVLVTGPCGVGKTALAHAIYNEVCLQAEQEQLDTSQSATTPIQAAAQPAVHFQQLNATELISSKTGESEQLIQGIFQTAVASQPAMVLIDNIEIVAPRAESAAREFERRVLTALMAQMDLLVGKQVIVLATTSRLQALDPQIRRNGRFDVELAVQIPDRARRVQILRKFLLPHGLSDAHVCEVAAMTPGYVPADVHQLVKEAVIDSLRHQNTAAQPAPLTLSNFMAAVRAVQPTTKREGFATIPSLRMEQIGGLEAVKRDLIKYILRPIKQPELYKQFNLPTHTGVVLYGAPGNGKSLLGRAIAGMAEANFISVKGPELLNQYVGESERAVRTLFERARAARPVVLFLDECECICKRRGDGANSEVTDRVVNQFLTELDGVSSDREGVYVIAATNRLDMLDKAIIRSGRLEKAIYVPFPDEYQRVDILNRQMSGIQLKFGQEFLLNISKERLEGYSGADLAAIVREAGMLCIQKDQDYIGEEDFVQAVGNVKRSVSQQDFDYYEKMRLVQERQ